MKIQHEHNDKGGSFFIKQDDKTTAEMMYAMPAADRMVIQHTEVNNALRGQNLGQRLIHDAVEYAREQKLKIVPVCKFANSVFEKDADYADVL